MRVLVTGSRDWADRYVVGRSLENLLSGVPLGEVLTVVHGACPTGADRMASEYARDRGPRVVEEAHPADWRRFGKRAGYRRNHEMVTLGADICVAFILNASKGATMTANLAWEAGIYVVRHELKG